MKFIKRKSTFFAVISLILIAAACSKQAAENRRGEEKTKQNITISVRLPIPAVDVGFSPFYLGIDRGIFAKAGFDVTLQPGSPELNPVKMVAQGTDTYGLIGGPELLFTARSKQAPVVGVALLGKNADLAGLISLKSSGITNLQQLNGKRVGFFYGHITTDILRMTFKKNRISVEEVDTGFDYGQLISGRVDAQWAFRSTAGVTLPAKGVEINFIGAAENGIATQGYTLIANEKYLTSNLDSTRRFVAAVVEASKYTVDHPDEAVAVAMRRDPNFKKEIGAQQAPLYAKAITNQKQVGQFPIEDQEATVKQMKDAGLLPDDFGIAGAFRDDLFANPK